MASNPQASAAPAPYRPDPAILSLGETFYSGVTAAAFPQAILRFRNQRWAEAVGLGSLDDAEWIDHFARFAPLADNLPQPLALAYHGHQFRVYNPEIGDGRGFLFAQLRDGDGRLLDLGTKGSGRTPYSRSGDGRLTLKGGVREVLATEMLEALGVDTSKSFSLIETGEALERGDEPSPTRSAVLVRLSHGHIRIGAFQRLAYHREGDAMRRLVDYTLTQLFGEKPGDDAPERLMHLVVARTAKLAASYMAAGFVHGVLNSDNINVTGESFDYGPWRFAPAWDPAFTAAYFDHAGLYSFGRQAEAILWDAMQLGVSLRAICDAEPLIAALDQFGPAYQAAVAERICWRLGVQPAGAAEDRALVETIERGLRASGMGIERFFHESFGGRIPEDEAFAGFADARAIAATRQARKPRGEFWDGTPVDLQIESVEAIWAAIDRDDDWRPFEAKIAAIRAFGAALA